MAQRRWCCCGYPLRQLFFFQSQLPFSCKCCQFTLTWLLSQWRRSNFERKAVVQLQIPLIRLTHYVPTVSNMPSTVTWSYKSPLRYVLRFTGSGKSICAVDFVFRHPSLWSCSGCCKAGTFSDWTAEPVPQSLLEGVKGRVLPPWLPSVGTTSVFKHLDSFCSIYSWIFLFTALCRWASRVPCCLCKFQVCLTHISRARCS